MDTVGGSSWSEALERGGARAMFWARDVQEGQCSWYWGADSAATATVGGNAQHRQRAIRHTQVALDAPNASADDAAPQTQHEGKHELAGKGEYKAAELTFAQEA